jgi:hypothetical protein
VAGFGVLNWLMVRNVSASMYSSSMSSTLWSKQRTAVRQCGRFLEWWPKSSREQSFFCEKNSRDAGSSKGWTVFFLLNLIVNGDLRELMSARASWTICEHFSPRRRSVVFVFSTRCGSFFWRARLERAFLGTLNGA